MWARISVVQRNLKQFPIQSYIRKFTEPLIEKQKSIMSGTSVTDIANQLNIITGYHHVERRKNSVLQKDLQLQQKKDDFLKSKLRYEDLIDERRKCQQDLDSLRDRKNSLSDADITRITELYRLSLSLDKQEKQAKEMYKTSTEQYERAQNDYLSYSMLM
ncbi:hypothetical protein HDV01_001332 [Terramyces sp. JEL0728]|nr:hypothetical protein HDV01_001332 [Terramyces sp. JEL0728]